MNVCTFEHFRYDESIQPRVGHLVYVGTEFRDEFSAVVYVRACDITCISRQGSITRATFLTHDLPSTNPYASRSGTEYATIDCTDEQHAALMRAIEGPA